MQDSSTHQTSKMATLAFSRSSFVALAIFLVNFHDHFRSEALVLEQKFSGKVVTETKVNLPADELWSVYRSPGYLKLLSRLQPDFYKTVTYVQGNGGAGTIVNVTVAPGTEGEYWYGKITKIDDKTKTRVLTHIQGKFRNSGFTYFASEYNVIKTGKTSSTIRFSLLFEIKQESLSNISYVIKTWDPATKIADYVNSMRSTPVVLQKEFSGEIVSDLHVNLPPNDLWREYRRNDFGHVVLRLMPQNYKQLTYENGNGEVGTLFNITLQPALGSLHWVEQYILFDNKKKTKAARYIKGGHLDSGFTEYEVAFTIFPKTEKSSISRQLETYKIKPESLFNASTLHPSWNIAVAMAKYTYSKKT